MNLRRDIGTLVISSKPHSLLEAQRMAADMKMWTRDNDRNATRSVPPSTPQRASPCTSIVSLRMTSSDSKPQQHPFTQPLSERMKLMCSKCGKIGHTSDHCYVRNFQQANQGKIPPRVHNIEEAMYEEEMSQNETEYPEYTAPQETECYQSDYHAQRQDSWSTPEQK